ncbi:MAG: Diacylglycerol kinase [candidate division WS2 bacterium]|nr:Diacylglycerol kinase [Candidatus Psychracetigena formicireducens]
MNISLIVNPIAASGKAKKLVSPAALQLEKSGCQIDLQYSRFAGHSIELSREALKKNSDLVVAVGGDGTVSEVANPLVGTTTLLGILPFGRGNDIATSLNIPKDPEKAVNCLLHDEVTTIDVGKVKNRYYLGVGGVGIDGEVVNMSNKYHKYLPHPFLAFFVGAIIQIVIFNPKNISFEIDGVKNKVRAYMIAIGNGPSYGGGMRILPYASMVDGELDLCLIRDIPKIDLLKTLPKLFSGSHINHPGVSLFKGKKITVESESNLFVHADGEILGRLPATFEVASEKLNVRKGRA